MNKTVLKKFATEARRELIQKVELQARKIGITADAIQKVSVESSDAIFIDGNQLSDAERSQRNKLIARINEISFNHVMEETAYTWFNRFIALRYMEVNDYLPTKVRVLSSNSDSTEPDMMKEPLSLDLELDKEYVYDLKMNNKTDELFKYLIKMHCNDLNRYMPFMFETIEDYSEILFPEGLLGRDSFVRQMTDTEVIPEENWGKVEIIGWLYQYYIAEEKDRVIMAKTKYKKNEIPFATQLFTPEWIVRYMVQNALGRYWIESHPEHRDLIGNWEFYLENQDSEEDYRGKLAPYINEELNVEDIKCFDPAMGSGHVLVYMFDVLHEIYSKNGYMEREIPRLIIEKNLYGLEIDDRAYQLASFSVVMKALQYNKHFFRSIEREGLIMNLRPIQETNSLSNEDVAFLAGEVSGASFEKMTAFINQFQHAKAIGSLIKIESHDAAFLQERLQALEQYSDDLFTLEMKDRVLSLFRDLIKQISFMDQKYDVFITNPPYAGSKYLIPELSTYIGKNYPDVKSDLFSAFIEYSFRITKENGQMGFITPYVWMFISSYEKIRRRIVEEKNISTLVQLEYNGFEAAMVPVCLFTMRNYRVNISGEYIKLSDFKGVDNQPLKVVEAVQNSNVSYRNSFYQENFKKISGIPISGYWCSEREIEIFEQSEGLKNLAEVRQGLATSDNQRFLRSWSEINFNKIDFNAMDTDDAKKRGFKWFPFNKGGEYRKWYGNHDYVINYEEDGYEMKNAVLNKYKYLKTPDFVVKNTRFYFLEAITWTEISSEYFGVRYSPSNAIFSNKSNSIFVDKEKINYYLGFLCSKLANNFIKVLNPTITKNVGDVSRLPIIEDFRMINKIDELVCSSIEIAKDEWDSFELSWDFKLHPFIKLKSSLIKEKFKAWESITFQWLEFMKGNEKEINSIFIEIYGLQDELTPEVEDKDITIRKADLERDVKSFISYAIGCSFGRYSLDEEGLVYAGGEFEPTRYGSFQVDEDNILPILLGSYFEDDSVSRFVEFVRVTFGQESLTENLDFVADALTRRKNETARETIRRYFINDFYKDHVQVYKKRPIYWQFTSGKEKAFNCLIYMHRYDKSTLSRIRTDYLHEVQIRLDGEKDDLLGIIESDSTTKEINSAKKELKSLNKKIDELKAYDELLHHMADMQIEIDLDDGVKVNYAKFDGLVMKI